ncbi:MAG TPA: pirin family protein [Streptosporangiaceae bacterium]|nr:pirin family protein [Streptosporangiaceae bacterium]
MSEHIGIAARTVARVDDRRRLGPDEQVDDKAMVFAATDPTLTDPFLFLSEDWFSKPGFDWHPHRGIETVTTVLDGVLEHGDNLGNAGALEPGDVQWMTAGRGIIHRELAYRDEHAHTLQLWLNLPATHKLTDTRYQDLVRARQPRITRPGAALDVISGTVDGVTGPARRHVDVQGAVLTLEPGTALDYPLPAAHRAFAYVLSGRVAIAGRRLAAGQTAWSDPVDAGTGDSTLRFSAPDGDGVTRVMIYSGTPLREPVAVGGPFVMNHPTEITQAFLDLRAGKFGEVPRQARLASDR